MKKHLGIFTIVLSTITFAAYSQENSKEKEPEKTQERNRARSTQGIRTDNELKDDRGEVPSNQYRKLEGDSVSNQETPKDNEDQVLEKNHDQGLSADDDSGLTDKNNSTQDGGQRTNTPAVIQSTTSESGSPAILSGKDGTERDGTNNVQRAKPNIAGAKEPGNMNVPSKKTAAKKETNAPGVRKQERQPRQNSEATSGESDSSRVNTQITVNSDSSMHQEETVVPMTSKEQRKAKRKARRNNRKD